MKLDEPEKLDLRSHDVADVRRQELLRFFPEIRTEGGKFTTPVEPLELAGKRVHSVAGGALLLRLESPLTLERMRAMAEAKPERAVCLDAGFAGNDQLNTKGATSFKTV